MFMARNDCTVCAKKTQLRKAAATNPFYMDMLFKVVKSSLEAGNAY